MERILSNRKVRSFYMIALTVLCLSLATATWAKGKQDFTLHNELSSTIVELYVSPHDADDWQEDVLGADTLADGDSLDITFDRNDDADMWDLKVVYANGTGHHWENLKLTELTDVTLHWSAKDDRVWATTKNGG